MKFKCLLLCLVINCMILIFSINPVFSAIYYVKNGGNDRANGLSDENAWATIAKVNSFARSPGFSSGDIIQLKRGSTWSNDQTLGYDGSSINWGIIDGLTIQDYGSGALPRLNANTQQPIYISSSGIFNLTIRNIDCSGMDWHRGWGGFNVWVRLVNGLVVDGIYIDGHVGVSSYNFHEGGLKVTNIEGDIEIKNCTIKNFYKNTFSNTLNDPNWVNQDSDALLLWYVDGGVPKLNGRVDIHDNTFQNVLADCIQIGGMYTSSGTNIYNNTLSNFGEQGLDFKNSAYVNIYHNDISHNNFGLSPGGGTWGGGGITTASGSGGIWDSRYVPKEFNIHDNYIHDTQRAGVAIRSIDSKVFENHFKDAGCAIFVYSSGGKIYNNLIDLTGVIDSIYFSVYKSAIYGANESFIRNNVVYNNTIYINNASYLYGISWQGKSGQSGNIIKNNIVQITNNSSNVFPLYVQDYDGSNTFPTVSHNDYYNSNNSNRVSWDGIIYNSSQISKWQTQHDPGAIFSDPMFSNAQAGDFSLLDGSPCILTNMTLGVLNLPGSSTSTTNDLTPPKGLSIIIGTN